MSQAAGRKSKLESLIWDRPSDYAKMVDYIRAGAFAKTAAAAVGVAPETFSRWLAKGETATSGPYRQFRQDIVRAVGEASVLAEADVHKADAKHWLKCGPRRLLGEEWREQEQPAALSVNLNTGSGTTVLSVQHATANAALQELLNAGVLSFTASPPTGSQRIIDAEFPAREQTT